MTAVAMLYTVVLTLSITSIVGFGTTTQSAVNMIIYICLFAVGSILYGLVEVDLKRRKMEEAKEYDNKRGQEEFEELEMESSKDAHLELPLDVKRKISED
jgi:amino acid permease